MKYFSGFLLLLLMFSLVACGGAASETDATADTPQPAEAVAQATEPLEPTATEPVEPTATQEQAVEEEPASAAEPASSSSDAGCRVEPISDLINIPTFPDLSVISDADWQHGGSADASVTVIEFGDYQ